MTDPDYITESDIDSRPTEFGQPVTEDDLMTYDEWWSEFFDNACCRDSGEAYVRFCPCGGTPIPTDISPLLAPEEEDGEAIYLRQMDSRADYMREREEMP